MEDIIIREKLHLEINVEIVEFDTKDTMGRIYYPDEGNKIQISKGLNIVELSETIFHEIGHLIDWYLSNSKQSSNIEVREDIAEQIGESLRFKIK